MRQGKLFWLLAGVGLAIVSFQFVHRGINPVVALIIALMAIPFGFALAWLKKKLG